MKTTDIIVENNDLIDELAEGPAIKTDFQKFWITVFNFAFSSMVKKAFFTMRVKNAHYFDYRNPEMGNIVFANHGCWWDGIIGYLLCRKIFKTEMYMMIEELNRFPLLSKIGAFSVEKDSAHSSLKALNYCTQFLQKPENSLWIFPQGFVFPPDYRPIKFAGGISYLSKKLNGVNLIPIAICYRFLREDRPEVFVEVGKPIIVDNKHINRKEFTQNLEAEFTALLDKQRNDISNGNLEGYEVFLKSRLCVVKLIEKYFKQFVRSINTLFF